MSAQTIQQAEALWRAHDYVGATKAFDLLLAANPTNAEVFLANGERLRPEYLVHEAGAKQSIRWAIRG